MKENHIVCDPAVLGGKPVVRGTRISVAFLLQCLASGMSIDDVLHNHPHLTREGVLAALSFAARSLEGETILPLPQ